MWKKFYVFVVVETLKVDGATYIVLATIRFIIAGNISPLFESSYNSNCTFYKVSIQE